MSDVLKPGSETGGLSPEKYPPSAGRKAGMPSGLPYIVVNEAAERYSFYGMKAILTVFMTRYLLDASGQEDMMTESEARIWYHTFVMGVYLLPLFGSLLSDIFLGKYKTIMALSLIYCLGHLVMALDHTRLGLSIGLSLIAVGAGGIKPCVSAHLGDQFSRSNSHLLERAYAWFYFAINIGAVLSMLAGEFLLQRFGPHAAFGLPGALMLLATIVFYIGRKEYRSIPPVGWKAFKHTLSRGDTRKAILRILPVFGLVAVFWSLYDQTGSSWVQQAQSDLMDKRLNFLGFSVEWLPSQIQAINPVLILIFVPLFSTVLYPLAIRWGLRPTPLRRIGFGMFLTALSFALIAALEYKIFHGQRVSVNGQIWAYVVLTAAEVLISMTCLEFAYTQAPNPAKSLVMGLYFLSLSAGNFLAVEVNRLMRKDIEVQMQGTESAGFAAPGSASARFVLLDKRSDLIQGRKIMFSGDCGLFLLRSNPQGVSDTLRLQGTYLMDAPRMSDRSFALLDAASREPLQIIGRYRPSQEHSVYVNRLVGAEYFWFFSALMTLAAVAFVPVALGYRTVHYIQEADSEVPGGS